jgi:hypothetical protein
VVSAAASAVLAVAAAGAATAGPRSAAPASRPGPQSAPARPSRPTVAAILTGFSASGRDILKVTRTGSGGLGPIGKAVIWVSPADAAPGTTVRSRILSITTAGALFSDIGLTYTASAAHPAAPGPGCATIFLRPHADMLPARGSPGRLIAVYYPQHTWAKAAVAVQAAITPGVAGLRACLAAGSWHAAGPGTIGGARVIEFTGSYGTRLWVSAATFLPVRMVIPGPGPGQAWTYDFRFLAPTSASQAMLKPPIPAGFTQGEP